jgi:hypothetical protein
MTEDEYKRATEVKKFRAQKIKELEDKAKAIYDELKQIRKQRNGSNN